MVRSYESSSFGAGVICMHCPVRTLRGYLTHGLEIRHGHRVHCSYLNNSMCFEPSLLGRVSGSRCLCVLVVVQLHMLDLVFGRESHVGRELPPNFAQSKQSRLLTP
jgi:hypothetical protein